MIGYTCQELHNQSCMISYGYMIFSSPEHYMLMVSTFCDKNVQISSLYCSFTVFYSFLGQLLTSFITNQKAHVLLCKVGQRLLCALQCHWLATSVSVNILWLTVRKGPLCLSLCDNWQLRGPSSTISLNYMANFMQTLQKLSLGSTQLKLFKKINSIESLDCHGNQKENL